MRFDMPLHARLALLLLVIVTHLSVAQAQSNQGVLAIGNLPSCGSTCSTLSQAAQACGGTTSSSQSIWNCFCQRVYGAASTYINSGTGLCADTCTTASQQSNAVNWFRAECGSDNGLSEHPDSNNGGAQTPTTTQPNNAATNTADGASSQAGASGDGNGVTGQNSATGSWWSNHWKWIVMLIVIVIGLILLGIIGVVLKRRYNRKRDQPSSSFNQGITTRQPTNMSGPYGPSMAKNGASGSQVDTSATFSADAEPGMASQLEAGAPGNGRDSSARTRDAFMPYGYGYTKSESKLAASRAVPVADFDDRRQNPSKNFQPVSPDHDSGQKANKKRILVRERDRGKS